MSSLKKNEASWKDLQIKVFSRWTTNALKPKNIVVNDITTELVDGVSLVNLAEILTKKTAYRKYDHLPKLEIQKVQNCDLGIDMFIKDGVKLVGIGGKDIFDKNATLTLGLIWSLILKYSIGAVQDNSEDSDNKQTATQALLQWCINETKDYDGVQEFKPLALAMCALLNNYRPDLIHYSHLDHSDLYKAATIAVDACNELDIAVLLDIEDIVNGCDEKTFYTQLSLIKAVLDKLSKRDEEDEPIIEERGVEIEEEDEEEIVESGHFFEGDNSEYAGRQFCLTLTVADFDPSTNGSIDYPNNDENNELNREFGGACFSQTSANNNENIENARKGDRGERTLALTNTHIRYLNYDGRKLDVAEPNVNDVNQQFTFGANGINTVIDTASSRWVVWDVANADSLNPPEGTPFYIFPFHAKHNQHFVYRNGHIYAQQNSQCVTFVGGAHPFVLMSQKKELRDRQTFSITLL